MKHNKQYLKTLIGEAEHLKAIKLMEEDGIKLKHIPNIFDRWEEYEQYLKENKKKYGELDVVPYEKKWEEYEVAIMKLLQIIDLYY